MSNFNLSEKMEKSVGDKDLPEFNWFYEKDVKEFIKKLKERVHECKNAIDCEDCAYETTDLAEDMYNFDKFIDKLAGKELNSPNPTKTTEEKDEA